MFQRSLRSKCGRLPNFCLIGVMEEIVKHILFPNPHRISSLACLLAKSPSLLDTGAPAHTGSICYKKPLEAADKQDFRKAEPFLVTHPHNTALAKYGRVLGTHKTVQKLQGLPLCCGPKLSRAEPAITYNPRQLVYFFLQWNILDCAYFLSKQTEKKEKLLFPK